MRPRRIHFNLILALLLTGWSFAVWSAAPDKTGAKQQLAESMLKDINQASWIVDGKGPRLIYVFFDPNCPYCQKLFVNTRDFVNDGKLEIRWIPVGILTTTSPGKAAAILGAQDPLKAFYQNEKNYDKGGGIDEDLASDEVEKKLKANADLLARTENGAVPLLLFRTDNGAPLLITGSPPKDKLQALLGLK